MDNILELSHITKQFSGVQALTDVSLCVKQGDIHALVGENGAGKSTIIKIITGAIAPTSGAIAFDGKPCDFMSPQAAIQHGIIAIYQEFNLIPYLTAAENIFYGNEPMRGLVVDYKKMAEKSAELFHMLGIDIDPRRRVRELGVAYQQMVEIAKAISKNCKLLIMDEPSAPLTNREMDVLYRTISILNQKGVTIIYISHRMEEIFEICKTVTVLRDGTHISTRPIAEVSRKDLVRDMVGRDLTEQFPTEKYAKDDVVLKVEGLTNRYVTDISFEVKAGEILGIGGLVGAGRTETARAIFGADAVDSGKVTLRGKLLNIHSPKDAIKAGLCLLPEDRKQQGVLLSMDVKSNVSFASMEKVCRTGVIQMKKEKANVDRHVKAMKIKASSLRQLTRNLSGGNQQKVVLAKWLSTDCDVFIFDEPTRGIDVGAKHEIYQLMKSLSAQGKAIILITSEMPELLGMSDRILVMRDGHIASELTAAEATQEQILELGSGE